MYQTVEALTAHLETVLKKAGFPASIHYMHASNQSADYVVFMPQDSPVSRDSEFRYDDDTFEFHCVSPDPVKATKMLDALVDNLIELSPGDLTIRGHELVGCENVQSRNVSEVTLEGGEDQYAGITAFVFKTQKKRPQ